MDATKIGKYREHDVYLTEEGGEFYIGIGNITHRYWIGAIEKILKDQPDYVFTTADEIEVVTKELEPIVAQIKFLRKIL